MINEQLLDYIKRQLEQGVDPREIRKALWSSGWQAPDIEEALSLLLPKNQQSSLNPIPPPPNSGNSGGNSSPIIIDGKQVVLLPSAMDLLRQAWDIYKQNAKIFLGITIVPFLFTIVGIVALFVLLGGFTLSAGALFGMGGEPMKNGLIIGVIIAAIIFFFFLVLIQAWSSAALVCAIRDTKESISVKESYRRGWRKLRSFLWVSIMAGFAVMAGIVFFIIPGIIAAVWFSLATFVVISENMKGTEAILKSKEYVKGNWGSMFWRLLVIGFISFVISLIVGIVFGIIIAITTSGETSGSLSEILSQIARNIVNILVVPLVTTYTYLIYDYLKTAKSGIPFAPSKRQKLIVRIAAILGFLIIPLLMGSIVLVSLNAARQLESKSKGLKNNNLYIPDNTVPKEPFNLDDFKLDNMEDVDIPVLPENK